MTRQRKQPLALNTEQLLMAAVQNGLPLTPRPYQTLAEQIGASESEVIGTLARWQSEGLLKRLGLVVQHRRLGYTANAMVVWNVPDAQVDAVGRGLKRAAGVTLCYRRRRQPPDWPYNLYCMIHGRDRAAVEGRVRALIEAHALGDYPHAVLFSTRQYKQRGGQYV